MKSTLPGLSFEYNHKLRALQQQSYGVLDISSVFTFLNILENGFTENFLDPYVQKCGAKMWKLKLSKLKVIL
jgi:hypothetical protein